MKPADMNNSLFLQHHQRLTFVVWEETSWIDCDIDEIWIGIFVLVLQRHQIEMHISLHKCGQVGSSSVGHEILKLSQSWSGSWSVIEIFGTDKPQIWGSCVDQFKKKCVF